MLKQSQVIILHRIPYGDSSLIVKGFCRNFGIQSFLVKSAKSQKFPYKNSLDTLAESEIVFSDSGKSDLHFIREASLIDWFPNLRKDLEKTAMASVMTEILLRYWPSGLSEELEFRYTEKAFRILDRETVFKDTLARWMWHVAECAGYALSLAECVRCGSPLNGPPADFHFESGGAICHNCLGTFSPQFSPEILDDIDRLHNMRPLQNFQSIEREFFKYLQTHLGENREIKSYRWLQEVRQYAFSSTNQRT